MSDYVDIQLSTWTNTRSRPLCDDLAGLLAVLQAYQSDYAAQGISAHASAAGANNISDGYATDGRQPITGNMILNLIACINQIVTSMAVTNVTGVGSPPSSTVNQIQVNGSPR